MWFHAITEFGQKKRYWWNRSQEDLVSELLLPLLSKQTILASRREKKSLFNFGSVSYATIIKTPTKLVRSGAGKPPKELTDFRFVKKHNATGEFIKEIRLLQSSPLTRSLLQQALSEPLNQIFVVMKLGDDFLDSAYEGAIKPVGEAFGFNVLRVDEIEDSGVISTQILENIARSRVVFVDLSGNRPNCYYEAGYAHALGKEIIFAIRGNEKIHFDLAGYRFIRWKTEPELRRKLRQRLDAIQSRAGEAAG